MRIIRLEDGVGEFGKWLAYRIYVSGQTVLEFSKDIGISQTTVRNHIKKRSKPSIAMVNMYCDYFGEGDIWAVYDCILKDWE